MKDFKDIEINGNVVRFLHIRKCEENKASVVIEKKKEPKRNEEETIMDSKTKERGIK